MFTEPKIEQHDAQPYVAIRTQVAMQELPTVIPQCIDEVIAWLGQQGIEPDGPPLMRYHVINMTDKLDVAIGWPVANAREGTGRITADTLPSGRYASLIFTGVENGMKGNGSLIEWVAAQGFQLDRWDDENGDAFAGRVEYMLDGPDDDPNPSNWKTEVAIKLADE